MRELAGKRVLVLGLGVSGRSAARFAASRGARVVAADERPAERIEGLGELPPEVELATGAPFPDPAPFDLVVPSPGVPAARWTGRARLAWGDLELAGRALAAPILAVTGTNGKSTTTLLALALLRAAGLRARAAGNLGTPALDLVGEPLDAVVLEVSSFQLEAVDAFRPRVAVVLNVTPDHLDRHGSLEAYAATKARLLRRQEPGDAAVLSFDDPLVRAMAGQTRARVVPFSTRAPLERGACLDAGAALLHEPGRAPLRIPLDALRLAGAHNRENALAALAAVWAFGADVGRAAFALATFEGLPHRAEAVATLGGVRFVNDSKGTNPGAATRALEGFAGHPLVWIAGGRDKGLDFSELAACAQGRVRAAILIGEAADKLAAALAGRVEVERAAGLEQAVRRAGELARPGDVVLLSPACASQDQFRDFAERGERFRRAVAALCALEERP
jgi:UDP-N-acetylmuramoylalanine--D-glutamate ligase